jgi:hypothetical protein
MRTARETRSRRALAGRCAPHYDAAMNDHGEKLDQREKLRLSQLSHGAG